MGVSLDIIFALTGGLAIALILGYFAQKIKISPIVGYLIAGILVSPNSPGIVVSMSVAQQCAEIGIVLLMFSVGINFKISDLIAVQKIAISGALVQTSASTIVSAVLVKYFLGWSWSSGIIFGIAISVASTVVLTRVLSDSKLLHTPTGHAAIGWLVMEDILTIVVLVLIPVFFVEEASNQSVTLTFIFTILKLLALIVIALVVGKKVIPFLLEHIAGTGNRELFILAILVVALGISVFSAKFFGASMALGAFLAGLVVGQSDFSARATSEALPISDIFSILFFVSVGMLFDLSSLTSSWTLTIILFVVVIIVKPITAITVVRLLKEPIEKSIYIGMSLGQIGEFSFILASFAVSYNIISHDAYNSIIFVSIVTIMLNTITYRWIGPTLKFLRKKGYFKTHYDITDEVEQETKDLRHVIVVGYGPVGKTVSKILLNRQLNVTVIEMNIDTVKKIKAQNIKELRVVHGDASQKEILTHSAIETAEALVVSSPAAPAQEITEIAKSLNSRIKILVHTTFTENAKTLRTKNPNLIVRSGEGSVAIALAKEIITIYGSPNFEEEITSIYKELL